MDIFIEETFYPLEVIQKSFESEEFYIREDTKGKFKKVGYNYSVKLDKISFVLPKVFMKNKDVSVFDNITPENLVQYFSKAYSEEIIDLLNNIIFNFYRGIKQFEIEHPQSTLINYSPTFRLKNKSHKNLFSYIDLIISFVAYYKKYRELVLFRYLESVKKEGGVAKWDKTIIKQIPILANEIDFFYDKLHVSQKERNNEDQLIIIFTSILYHLSHKHNLGLNLNYSIPIFKGEKFKNFEKNGLSKLKRLKNSYFSDVMKEMYNLCEIYLLKNERGAYKKDEEFISISNYNVLFEAMVDKLLSDRFDGQDEYSKEIKKLKNNRDGKIIDHLFKGYSIFDDTEIYYIGDSKYYKPEYRSSGVSDFKQFTYAKNIIQYHIDLLNKNGKLPGNLCYRDGFTEGYNVTPNFFIYGKIGNPNDKSLELMKLSSEPKLSVHFPERLFDRDSLYVFEYSINYLFILNSYVLNNSTVFNETKKKFKKQLREDFYKWFLLKSGFVFYQSTNEINEDEFLKKKWQTFYGKVYRTSYGKLILALPKSDENSYESVNCKWFTKVS